MVLMLCWLASTKLDLYALASKGLDTSGLLYTGPTVWMTCFTASLPAGVMRASPVGQRTPGVISATALQASSSAGPATL